MKKAVFTFLKFLLFLFAYAAGSFFPPFHIEKELASDPGTLRVFIWDGVYIMLALYIIIIATEALRKRLAISAPWTTLALILAAAIGYAAKLGFATHALGPQ